MTDIAKRLREEGEVSGYRPLMLDAADEIDRLRAELNEWREIVENEPDKLSFDALVRLAKLILDTHYPVTVFPPLDNAARFNIRALTGRRDDGPAVVMMLREVIRQIEDEPP